MPYTSCGESSVILCHMYKVASVHCICTIRGPDLWGQDVCSRTNPMGTRCSTRTHLMGHVHADQLIQWEYKGPFLWGHDACTEDQSYGTVHVATCTNVQPQVALYHV